MTVICIFLAAKVEERKDINLEQYFNTHFKSDPVYAGLTLELLKYHEIQLCKALDFEFYVHSPILCISHLYNLMAT